MRTIWAAHDASVLQVRMSLSSHFSFPCLLLISPSHVWQSLATEGQLNAVLGDNTTGDVVVPLASRPTADVLAAEAFAAEELQVWYLLA